MTSLLPRLLVHTALAATLTTGVLSAPAGTAAVPLPTSADERTAAPPAPRTGECRDITLAESNRPSDPDPAVRCSAWHSARTIRVASTPKGLDLRDVEAVAPHATRACLPAWRTAVGGTARSRVLSAYIRLWFVPTREQLRAGQRWIRCDLALAGGKKLAPLPHDRQPALGGATRSDAEARCALGKRQGYALTSCARTHEFRARGTFTIRGRAYPGEQARWAAAKRHCPRLVGPRAWLLTWPSKASWRSGAPEGRLFVCSEKTRR